MGSLVRARARLLEAAERDLHTSATLSQALAAWDTEEAARSAALLASIREDREDREAFNKAMEAL